METLEYHVVACPVNERHNALNYKLLEEKVRWWESHAQIMDETIRSIIEKAKKGHVVVLRLGNESVKLVKHE